MGDDERQAPERWSIGWRGLAGWGRKKKRQAGLGLLKKRGKREKNVGARI